MFLNDDGSLFEHRLSYLAADPFVSGGSSVSRLLAGLPKWKKPADNALFNNERFRGPSPFHATKYSAQHYGALRVPALPRRILTLNSRLSASTYAALLELSPTCNRRIPS
jgi:hypothetical protein